MKRTYHACLSKTHSATDKLHIHLASMSGRMHVIAEVDPNFQRTVRSALSSSPNHSSAAEST